MNAKKERKRLDVLMMERGLAPSRERAQAYILAGEVWSGETRLEKPGESHPLDLEIEVRSRSLPFSSRAGSKLDHALDVFKIPVEGRICLDIGASTGGFTDCLLKRGANRVIAIDVGYGQLDQKLRNDPRVLNAEKVNARHLTPELLTQEHGANPQELCELSLGVVDVSFISLGTVLPPLGVAFPQVKDWVVLFKPQFEVGPKNIGKGGVVKDVSIIPGVISQLHEKLLPLGWRVKNGPESSPLPGKKSGNLEYLVHYELSPSK